MRILSKYPGNGSSARKTESNRRGFADDLQVSDHCVLVTRILSKLIVSACLAKLSPVSGAACNATSQAWFWSDPEDGDFKSLCFGSSSV
jgi:hypothetical protein